MSRWILIPDSFKGTMSSVEVCQRMRRALLRHVPDAEVISIPVADGGEGSVEAFLTAMGGRRVEVPCTGPDFRPVAGFYGLLLDGRTADPARVLDLLARLGLEGKRRAFPAQLSGGQQQRVAIARALITHPALLLADEPTGNLDSAASESVMRMLVQLNETTGQTIVMITHDEALALQAKRIIRLRDGRIVKDEVRA